MSRRHILILCSALISSAHFSEAAGPEMSTRPLQRSETVLVAAREMQVASQTGLAQWVNDFRVRAIAKGISPDTFDRAMAGVRYDAAIIRRDRNQAEFTKTIWDYLDTAVSDLRIENGKAALRKWDKTLSAIEARYGVEREVIVAIWGLESAYGTFRGKTQVINALTTLAYDARRTEFFEGELLDALRILDSGDTNKSAMRGSWAGAMGHTQFMPSSFQTHAVDFDGDGKRNIWGDDPKDALASTGAYLRHFGWKTGQPWGVEVQLPAEFDVLLADRDVLRLPSVWAELGIVDMSGDPIPDHGKASVLLPGGAEGAAFLIFENFSVLEKYNTADAYVIGVGHLSDRIKGGPPIKQGWPRALRALTFDERTELQKRLTSAGFDTVKIDAKMGPLTINAVRRFQQSQGVRPDGYPSLRLLERLRAL